MDTKKRTPRVDAKGIRRKLRQLTFHVDISKPLTGGRIPIKYAGLKYEVPTDIDIHFLIVGKNEDIEAEIVRAVADFIYNLEEGPLDW